MRRRLIVGPFNRVEGDLEIRLDMAEGVVEAAHVTSPMYRGFETILQGRPPLDALVIAPRICGICSVSQSVAAARALGHLSGIRPAMNGHILTDLALACENATDHLTHFLLFFLPDFTRPCYANRPWYADACLRFAAQTGQSARLMMAARARFLHIMGIIAGKWPHSLTFQPGGTTKSVDQGEKLRLLSILAEFREALEQHLFAAPLELITAFRTQDQLWQWADDAPMQQGDFRLFLHMARDLHLDGLGLGPASFLSHGAFDLSPPGVLHDGHLSAYNPDHIREDLSHAWLSGAPLHPAHGQTIPDADKLDAYSWCKAPRLNGSVMEVGAIARQRVASHPLAQDLVVNGGASVLDRVILRLVELAQLVQKMDGWVRTIRPREEFCLPAPLPDSGQACGLVEAARGALGHWVSVDQGQISRYQIIAPTSWNFSPRDQQGQAGPLEQALQGAPILPGESTPVSVQHIVRSFDPCMACTVH